MRQKQYKTVKVIVVFLCARAHTRTHRGTGLEKVLEKKNAHQLLRVIEWLVPRSLYFPLCLFLYFPKFLQCSILFCYDQKVTEANREFRFHVMKKILNMEAVSFTYSFSNPGNIVHCLKTVIHNRMFSCSASEIPWRPGPVEQAWVSNFEFCHLK